MFFNSKSHQTHQTSEFSELKPVFWQTVWNINCLGQNYYNWSKSSTWNSNASSCRKWSPPCCHNYQLLHSRIFGSYLTSSICENLPSIHFHYYYFFFPNPWIKATQSLFGHCQHVSFPILSAIIWFPSLWNSALITCKCMSFVKTRKGTLHDCAEKSSPWSYAHVDHINRVTCKEIWA